MKRIPSALLLIILLIQGLPIDALASVGKVLSEEELNRAYALTGLGQGDGLYHNGMKANESMSGMQLAHWLEERLDNQLHNIDDVFARARYQLEALQEKYPTIYKTFTDSPYYGQVKALTLQAEELRMEMNYQLERVKTDINMISQMYLLLEEEDSLFDSERVRASARIEAATAELTGIRTYVVQNADIWDAELLEWTADVQSGEGSGAEDAVSASLKSFLETLWKKYSRGEGSYANVEAELRKVLVEQFKKRSSRGELAEAFADDAIALLKGMIQQYDPDGEMGKAFIADFRSLVRRLYEKYGPKGADDATLTADLEALMHALWEKYGPDSEINQAFDAAWKELMIKYGVDSATVEAFTAETDALLENLWNKYGPNGENRDALRSLIKSLLSAYGDAGDQGGVGRWISSLFTSMSKPVSNSAPVVAVTASNTRLSRLSSAAGVKANDADAEVTVITKNQICISVVTGVNQQRVGVPGVSVKIRDATKPRDPLALYHSDEKGNVILPTNLFVADKYEVIHLYVEVDPRAQGYHNFVIEDLDLTLGGCFMGTLEPIDGTASNGVGVAANAANDPYIVSASFNGKDIMYSEYEMIYSPVNGKNFTIKVVVNQSAGQNLPDLMMSWYENEGGFSAIKKHWAEATSKTTTSEGYTEYTFKGPWKQRFSPNASSKQRPTFSFGKEDGALSFTS